MSPMGDGVSWQHDHYPILSTTISHQTRYSHRQESLISKWSIILSLKLVSTPHSYPRMSYQCDVINPPVGIFNKKKTHTLCDLSLTERTTDNLVTNDNFRIAHFSSSICTRMVCVFSVLHSVWPHEPLCWRYSITSHSLPSPSFNFPLVRQKFPQRGEGGNGYFRLVSPRSFFKLMICRKYITRHIDCYRPRVSQRH
jgi:hypothetical protein